MSMKKYIPILLILLFDSHLGAQIKLKETSIDIVEKLIELNPENFEKDFTSYHQPTALYCAQLSDLVYWKHEHIEWLRDKLNELYPKNKIQTKFLEVKENNAQALLWQTNEFLVIIFRGTEFSVLRDWITDGKFWKYENTSSSDKILKGLLPGHGGFRKSLIQFIQDKDIYGEIAKIVTFNPNYKDPKKIPIYLACHS